MSRDEINGRLHILDDQKDQVSMMLDGIEAEICKLLDKLEQLNEEEYNDNEK